MKFLFKPHIFSDECLSSYIHRVAQANYVSPHDLWKLLLPEGAHYPQSSISSSLDICPDSLFNIEKFAEMLEIKKNKLYSLTFKVTFAKFGITETSRSRTLSGILHDKRKFCSDCLKDSAMYKLLWQIKELLFCPVHNTLLSSRCNRCDNEMSILPNITLGICPYCNFELKYNTSKKYMITQNDHRILRDWIYLLNEQNLGILKIDSFTYEQSLALKLLSIIKENTHIPLSDNDMTSIAIIKQVARDSLSTRKSIHLNTILYWIRKLDIFFEDLFALDIPDQFVELIFNKSTKLINQIACISPWCSNFNKSSSLKRTLTSKNIRKNGQVLHYYMYCTKCGIEYCNDNYSLQMIERGYFIDLAWNKVRTSLYKKYSLKELAVKFDTSIDKVRRSIIFLTSNNLISNEELPLNLPKQHDYEIVEKIKTMINQRMLLKNIKSELCLTYNEILFYWLKSDIMISYIERSSSKSDNCVLFSQNHLEGLDHDPINDTNINKSEFIVQAIDFLNNNNSTITIKSISNYLDVCPETLRNWGVLHLIKQAKQNQRNKKDDTNRINLVLSAEKIVNDMLINNEQVLSDEVYKKLGRKRNSIVRTYPEVTEQISEIIKRGKLEYKLSNQQIHTNTY